MEDEILDIILALDRSAFQARRDLSMKPTSSAIPSTGKPGIEHLRTFASRWITAAREVVWCIRLFAA